jgi:hypothetical protein
LEKQDDEDVTNQQLSEASNTSTGVVNLGSPELLGFIGSD